MDLGSDNLKAHLPLLSQYRLSKDAVCGRCETGSGCTNMSFFFKRWKEPLRRIDSHPVLLCELFKEFKEVTCRSTTEEAKEKRKKGAVAAASYLSDGNVLSLCVKESGVKQCWFLNVNLYLLNLFHFTFTSLIINSLTSRRHFFFPSPTEWAEGNLLYLVIKKEQKQWEKDVMFRMISEKQRES